MRDAPDGVVQPSEQRLRVTFATDDSVKYVGHLDMARAWERAIRRSGLPLAYSQGFNPQPRLQFAAALPLGFTAESEILDIYLSSSVEPDEAVTRLQAALPRGVVPLNAQYVDRGLPALQAQVARAYYRVEVETGDSAPEFGARLAGFVSREEAWRERRKGKEIVRYDLRPLVLEIVYTGACEIGHSFDTLMLNEPGATGRPDELLAELGFGESTHHITRTHLIMAD